MKTSVNYGQWSAVKTICHSNGRPIKKRMAHKNKKHLNLLKVFWCMSSLMRVIRSLNSFGPIFTIHLIGIDRSSLEYRQEMTSDPIISFGNQSFDLFVCNWQTQTNIWKKIVWSPIKTNIVTLINKRNHNWSFHSRTMLRNSVWTFYLVENEILF